MDRAIHISDLPEEPHPFLRGVTMKTLLSRRDDNAGATCIIVRCPAGSEIEEHAHEGQDDIIYVLEGEGKIGKYLVGGEYQNPVDYERAAGQRSRQAIVEQHE